MKLLRFVDLKVRGIINNMTLRRWIAEHGFPPGVQLGPNSVAWRESEVEAWLGSRQRPDPAALSHSAPKPKLTESGYA
jgi:prophage regulatory protein